MFNFTTKPNENNIHTKNNLKKLTELRQLTKTRLEIFMYIIFDVDFDSEVLKTQTYRLHDKNHVTTIYNTDPPESRNINAYDN